MKYLIVFVHPEQKSFSKSLMDAMVSKLENMGHEVKVSDLYAEKFKAVVDADDFLNHDKNSRLKVIDASTKAYNEGKLTDDVKAEQEKLLWADTVIFQFPLWWYGMPAMLKGYFDRVYSSNFGYGRGEYNSTHWGDNWGEGIMKGKRAMVVVTIGGWEEHFGPRAINGPIDDLLYPINHNMLFYAGFTVMKSIPLYRIDKATEKTFKDACKVVEERLENIETDEPIPYRMQNYGDYEIPSLALKEGLEKEGQAGFHMHIKNN